MAICSLIFISTSRISRYKHTKNSIVEEARKKIGLRAVLMKLKQKLIQYWMDKITEYGTFKLSESKTIY